MNRCISKSTLEQRLVAAGYALPAPPKPRGAYAPFHVQVMSSSSRRLTVSGQTCCIDGVAIAGCCAPGNSLEPACAAAKVAMLNVLAAVAPACGGVLPTYLDVCRVRGFIRSTAEFTAHAAVLDAASDILSTA